MKSSSYIHSVAAAVAHQLHQHSPRILRTLVACGEEEEEEEEVLSELLGCFFPLSFGCREGDRHCDYADLNFSLVCGNPTWKHGSNDADFIHCNAGRKGGSCTTSVFMQTRRSRGGTIHSRFCILYPRHFPADVTDSHQCQARKLTGSRKLLRTRSCPVFMDWDFLDNQECVCTTFRCAWRSCGWKILRFAQTRQIWRPTQLACLQSQWVLRHWSWIHCSRAHVRLWLRLAIGTNHQQQWPVSSLSSRTSGGLGHHHLWS